MDKKTKKIKDINDQDMEQFSKEFFSLIKTNEIPPFLSRSEEFQQKVLRVDHVSGSALIGMGLNVFRKDEKDIGSTINVDIYRITDDELIKFESPFLGHWLPSLPPPTNDMFKICPNCKRPFKTDINLSGNQVNQCPHCNLTKINNND